MSFANIGKEFGIGKGTANKIYHKEKKNEPVS